MVGSYPDDEIRLVEMDAFYTGRRVDGHGEHLTPLDGIAQVGIRFNERALEHCHHDSMNLRP